MSAHSESYIDSEGEERCTTCDKWLEPSYYGIEDHASAISRNRVPGRTGTVLDGDFDSGGWLFGSGDTQ